MLYEHVTLLAEFYTWNISGGYIMIMGDKASLEIDAVAKLSEAIKDVVQDRKILQRRAITANYVSDGMFFDFKIISNAALLVAEELGIQYKEAADKIASRLNFNDGFWVGYNINNENGDFELIGDQQLTQAELIFVHSQLAKSVS